MNFVPTRSIMAIAIVAAVGITIPTVAEASAARTTPVVPGAGFVTAQKSLEAQLANRTTQLQHLSADVTAATSLSASATSTLEARLTTEESSITSLSTKVPTDTTGAELGADRAAMFRANRVYAVMVPQVFETIEASVVAKQVTTLQANEAMLQSEATSLVGQPGYQNALNHYNNYVARLAHWSTRVASLEGVVLAQTPQGYPGNTRIFVAQNHVILNANTALAYATYDASIIGLASGGYTGS